MMTVIRWPVKLMTYSRVMSARCMRDPTFVMGQMAVMMAPMAAVLVGHAMPMALSRQWLSRAGICDLMPTVLRLRWL